MAPPLTPATTPLGRVLQERRLAAGMAREDLAHQAGLRSMTVIRIEMGHTTDPHWSTVVAIARVLDLDLEWLAAAEAEAATQADPAA